MQQFISKGKSPRWEFLLNPRDTNVLQSVYYRANAKTVLRRIKRVILSYSGQWEYRNELIPDEQCLCRLLKLSKVHKIHCQKIHPHKNCSN